MDKAKILFQKNKRSNSEKLGRFHSSAAQKRPNKWKSLNQTGARQIPPPLPKNTLPLNSYGSNEHLKENEEKNEEKNEFYDNKKHSFSPWDAFEQFYYEILQWDIGKAYHRIRLGEQIEEIIDESVLYKDDKDMDLFKQMNTDNDSDREDGEVKALQVPSNFNSYEHYFSVWKPLAIEEVKAQTINTIASNISIDYTSKHSTKLLRFIPIEIKLVKDNAKERITRLEIPYRSASLRDLNEKKRVQIMHSLDEIYPSDLVIIIKNIIAFRKLFDVRGEYDTRYLKHSNSDRDQSSKNGQKEDLSVMLSSVTGIIHSRHKNFLVLEAVSERIEALKSLTDDKDSTFYMYKLSSLVTSIREFRALINCRDYPLMPLLLAGAKLDAQNSSTNSKLESLGRDYVKYLKTTFNQYQIEAISKSIETTKGITLIKGPPGTGKTTTLLGLLNSLHVREYNRYYESLLQVAKLPDEETENAWNRLSKQKPHILVTAPSNAAVDNIILKIMKNGFMDSAGSIYFPNIIRFGPGQSSCVKDVSLEEKVEQLCLLDKEIVQKEFIRLQHELHNVHQASMHHRNGFREISKRIESDFNLSNNDIHSTDFKHIDYTIYPEYQEYASNLTRCLEKMMELQLEIRRYRYLMSCVDNSNNNTTKMGLQVTFLDTAHIVFTTLSSAGSNILDSSEHYDVLVVDEAAQAVELSTIIPMRFGSQQCVLVGDPNQLCATVFSRQSSQSLYERSLFERLEAAGHPIHVLQTQYRSHPLISEFPSDYFYKGILFDGDNVKSRSYDKSYHHLGRSFQPLVFWNVVDSRENINNMNRLNMSKSNTGEALLAVNIYLTLKHYCDPKDITGKVGVITPYTAQLEEIKRKFKNKLGDQYLEEVEINTIDGFQGREKDIIILSTVRADYKKKSIGFLNDIRRMNVALTRAKYACFVLGNEKTLSNSTPWADFLRFCHKKNCFVPVLDCQSNLLALPPSTANNELISMNSRNLENRQPPVQPHPFSTYNSIQSNHHVIHHHPVNRHHMNQNFLIHPTISVGGKAQSYKRPRLGNAFMSNNKHKNKKYNNFHL